MDNVMRMIFGTMLRGSIYRSMRGSSIGVLIVIGIVGAIGTAIISR